MRTRSFARLVFAASTGLLLAACGGGGGGGGGGGSTGGGGGGTTLSQNADLSELILTDVSLEPALDPDVTAYTADVGFLVHSILVDGVPDDPAASISVNGIALGAGGRNIRLVPGANLISVRVTAENGTTTQNYQVTVTRQSIASFAQDSYYKASNAEGGDGFGRSLALSGNTLAVGTRDERSAATGIDGDQTDNSAEAAGAVYVFVRDDVGVWSQQAYIKASNAEAFDWFGETLALSGDTLAVSAVFESSDATGVNGDQASNLASDSGAVYVFTRDDMGVWSQQADLKASNTGSGDQFGMSLALDGNTLAVGTQTEASSATGIDGDQTDNSAANAGAVYVFTRDAADVWSQQAYIKASNTEAIDTFGASIALSGDTLAVGARLEDSAATGIYGDQSGNTAVNSGAVYVFARDASSVWSQQAYIKASNTEANDRFGNSVALSGDTLAVGAYFESSAATGANGNQADNSASGSGAVYVFTRDTTDTWFQQAYLKASNTEADDLFGSELALSRDTLAVLAAQEASASTGINGAETDNSAADAGGVYLFTRDIAGVWSQQAYLKPDNIQAEEYFGGNLALSEDSLAVSAMGEDSSAQGIDGDQANDLAPGSGAAYIFR